jgi:hypothetical protein
MVATRTGVDMRQLKMFAPSQQKCVFCQEKFVPIAVDVIRLWEQGFAEEHGLFEPVNWAVDRVYQENLKYCSPECATASELAAVAAMKEIVREQLRRKYR